MEDDKNLYQETLAALAQNEKQPHDVYWVGSADGQYAITWGDFSVIADFEYDAGYGGNEIKDDLVVVGNDWWLSRWEYDGSEGWKFETKPIKFNAKQFTRGGIREYLTWDENDS